MRTKASRPRRVPGLTRNYTDNIRMIENGIICPDDLSICYPVPLGRSGHKHDSQLWDLHFSGWQRAYSEWRRSGSTTMPPPQPESSGHLMFENPIGYGRVEFKVRDPIDIKPGMAIIVNEVVTPVVDVDCHGYVYETTAIVDGSERKYRYRLSFASASVISFDFEEAKVALRNCVSAVLDGWDRELRSSEDGLKRLSQIIDATVAAKLRGEKTGVSPFIGCVLAGMKG